MAADAPELSVIIPMYQEARRIGPTLADVAATLRAWRIRAEVILVDDGSTDGTEAAARGAMEGLDGVAPAAMLRHDRNRGKGAAVRTGLRAARGTWRLIMDADNSCRLGECRKLMERARATGAFLAAGSRRIEGARVTARASRRLAGGVFNACLRLLGLRLLKDTQCGFKLYRRELAELVAWASVEDRFAFDVEHLVIARRARRRVEEVGVEWVHAEGGTVRPVRDGLRMLARGVRIRWRDLRGEYARAARGAVAGGDPGAGAAGRAGAAARVVVEPKPYGAAERAS